MADIKKGANEPFLYDDQTDRITGLKNSDSTEKKFVYTDGSSGPLAVQGQMTVVPSASVPTSNVVLGPSAGAAMTTTTDECVAIGTNALAANTADGNVAIGAFALDGNVSGTRLVGIGLHALGAATHSGSDNVAVGHSSATNVSSGSRNTAIGGQNLGNVTTQSDNVVVGAFAGATSQGASNVFIGSQAGRYRGSGTDILGFVDQTILIGANARAADNSQTNQIVIGQGAIGDGSDTTVIGNTSTTSTRIAGTATSVFAISGDTMRITGTRTPASNAAGTAGDFTFGTDGGTTYLYYCIASGNWGRVALTTGY